MVELILAVWVANVLLAALASRWYEIQRHRDRQNSIQRIARQSEALGEYDMFTPPEDSL